jgi:hypothetical protein
MSAASVTGPSAGHAAEVTFHQERRTEQSVRLLTLAMPGIRNGDSTQFNKCLVHRFLSDCAFGFDRTELAE